MKVHEVTAAKKVAGAQAFFGQYIHDDSVKYVFSPQQASDLGIQSHLRVCYDLNGIVGAAHFTTPFEDAKQALDSGAPEALVVEFLRKYRMLYNLAVREDMRGQGIGTALLDAVDAGARTQGADAVIGIADGDLARLERFYSRHGYQVLPVGASLCLDVRGDRMVFPIDIVPGKEVQWFRKLLQH